LRFNRREASAAVGWKRMLGGLLLGTLCFNDLLDCLVEYRYLVLHNVPDNTVINSKTHDRLASQFASSWNSFRGSHPPNGLRFTCAAQRAKRSAGSACWAG
jgi:hypothetical protein